MTELTFPQHGDLPDAAHWAFAGGTPPTSCIVSGLGLTPDYGVPDVDIAGGKAVIDRGEMDTAHPNIDPPESLQDSVAVVQVEAQTVGLDDGATNHLWLQANVSSDDSPQVVANTTGTAPTTASVKIGEVDTSADTASGQWRLVAPDGTLTFPSKTAASATAGELGDGTVVYDRGGHEHYGIVAGSLKGMVGFSDPDGDGTYTLPADADGAEVGTLSAADGTFSDSLTDPAGNTYTGSLKLSEEEVEDIIGNALGRGLSYDDAEGIIFETATGPNPYESAQTFSESGISLSTTNVVVSNGSLGLSTGTIVDYFEDGAVSADNGWTWNSASSLSAQQSVVLSGAYSGEIVGDNAPFVTRSSTTTSDFSISLQFNDYPTFEGSIMFVGNGTYFGVVEFNSDGDIQVEDNGTLKTVRTYQTGTTYDVRVSFDFGVYEYDVSIDGALEADGFGFRNNVNEYDEVITRNNTDSGKSMYIDNLSEGPQSETAGSAVIEWDNGVPTDIFEWDTATFTRTLDSETVDVFVAYDDDGGGWSRTNGGNPISRNYDLQSDSNISASDNVRIEAELSRTDTSNNPTLDSAYRSWLV